MGTFTGTPPTYGVGVTPSMKPPMTGFARNFGDWLNSLIGQPMPSYPGSLDPGLSPTLQNLGRMMQTYASSNLPSAYSAAGNTLSRFSNPGFENPLARVGMSGAGPMTGGFPNYFSINKDQALSGGQPYGAVVSQGLPGGSAGTPWQNMSFNPNQPEPPGAGIDYGMGRVGGTPLSGGLLGGQAMQGNFPGTLSNDPVALMAQMGKMAGSGASGSLSPAGNQIGRFGGVEQTLPFQNSGGGVGGGSTSPDPGGSAGTPWQNMNFNPNQPEPPGAGIDYGGGGNHGHQGPGGIGGATFRPGAVGKPVGSQHGTFGGQTPQGQSKLSPDHAKLLLAYLYHGPNYRSKMKPAPPRGGVTGPHGG